VLSFHTEEGIFLFFYLILSAFFISLLLLLSCLLALQAFLLLWAEGQMLAELISRALVIVSTGMQLAGNQDLVAVAPAAADCACLCAGYWRRPWSRRWHRVSSTLSDPACVEKINKKTHPAVSRFCLMIWFWWGQGWGWEEGGKADVRVWLLGVGVSHGKRTLPMGLPTKVSCGGSQCGAKDKGKMPWLRW